MTEAPFTPSSPAAVPAPAPSPTPSPAPSPASPPHNKGGVLRSLRWIGRAIIIVLALVLLLGSGIILFAYSPSGGPTLARLATGIVNGLETGISIEIGTIQLQWPLNLRVRDVRLLDAAGEWLAAPLVEVEVNVQPASLVPQQGKWRVQIASALVRQPTWSRLPQLPAAPEGEVAPPQQQAISLLPDWLSVEAENIVLDEARIGAAALALTPAEPYIPAFSTVQMAVQGMVSALTARAEIHAEIRPVPAPEQAALPALPDSSDVQEGPAQAEAAQADAERPDATPPDAAQARPQPVTRVLLKAEWNNNTLSLNSRVEDNFVLAPYLPAPALPAHSDAALPAQSGSMSGSMSAPMGSQQGGQAESSNPRPQLVIHGDITVHIPVIPPIPAQPMRVQWALQGTTPALPTILFNGAANIDDTALAWENVEIRSPLALAKPQDISATTPADGVKKPEPTGDSPAYSLHSTGSFHFQQGPNAELDLHVPDIAALAHFGLPMPLPLAPQSSLLAKMRITAPATVSIDIHSPALVLPQGSLQNLSLKVQASQPAPAASTAPSTEPASTVGTAPAPVVTPLPTDPTVPTVPTVTVPTWSLPTALKGRLELTVQSCMGYGPLTMSTNWELDNILSKMGFRIAKLQATMQGLKVHGGLAYADDTFTDAALDLAITDTSAIAKLFNVPLKGCPLTFTAKVVPDSSAKSIHGQLNFGAGSYGTVAWLSGEGTVRANKNKADLTLNVKGKLAARVRCSYQFAEQILRIDNVELSESTLKMGAKLLAATDIRFANGINIGETNISLRPSGTMHIKGKLEAQGLALEASVADLPLALAKAFTTAPIPQGILSARVALKGSPSAPSGSIGLRVDNMQLANTVDGPQASLVVDGTLQRANTKGGGSHTLQLKSHWEGLESLNNFSATAQIPLSFTPSPSLLMNAPLRANLSWQGDIAPLWRLVPLPGRSLSGKAEVQAQVQGSLGAPLLTGNVFVGQGRFVDAVDGLMLDAITLEARYDSRTHSLLRLQATDGRGGTVQLDGSLNAPATVGPKGIRNAGSAGENVLALHGIINKLRPLRRDDLAVQLSGTVDISGPLSAPLIAANVCVDQALLQLLDGFGGGTIRNITVEERTTSAGISATTATAIATAKALPTAPKTGSKSSKKATDKKAKKASPSATAVATRQPAALEATDTVDLAAVNTARVPRCDIRITAPNRLYIRGKGLDSEWKAKLRLSGPLSDPLIVGNVTPIRGNLELLGHQFTLASGDIAFTGGLPVNPALDVSLQYKSADIIALIIFSGSAKHPKMRLSSQPVLPDDEIIAHILFGKNMNSLSRFEALQAANTARQLVDLGPSSLDIMATTRDLLGLEVLRLGSAEASRQTHAPRDASLQGTSSANPDDQAPTIEAGKYILDNVYVGLEQGTDAKTGTIVRVEVELLPNLSVEGRTSNESTGVGINWKRDY